MKSFIKIKNINKFFLLIFFIFIFNSTFLFSKTNNFIPEDSYEPYCLGKIKFDNNLIIESLEIEIDKNKKWSKNLLKLITYFQEEKSKSEHENWFPEFRIDKNFKKKFKAKTIIKYKNYEPCMFNSWIRITGDMWWHIGWSKGVPISSISVELINGHINYITKFKLLLPDSRNGDNEIFTSVFFRQLGFLSPKTFYISAKVNSFKNKYIFQEDLTKEFVESSSNREGPILEGDERFTISLRDSENLYDNKTNLSKLVNKSYATKNDSNGNIALHAVSNLNLLYLLNHNSKYPNNIKKNIMLYLFSDVFFENEKNQSLLETFEAFVYAIDAGHGLSPDDRRFYFNVFEKSFVPIYYDGKSYILEEKQRFTDYNLSFAATLEAKKGSHFAIEKLSNIDKNNFLVQLKNAGIEIESKYLDSIISKINNRLKILKNSNPSKINSAKNAVYFSIFQEKEIENKRLVFTNYLQKNFQICDFKIEYCETIKLDILEYNKYLAEALNQDFELFYKNFNIKNDLIFVHTNTNYEKLKPMYSDKLQYWNTVFVEESYIEHNSEVELKIDNLKKVITVFQKSTNGIVLIKGGKLANWKILFNGIIETNNNTDITLLNPFNLTGCLNLYNVSFENTSIITNNTFCEDAVNIIKSRGTIDLIKTTDSASDSLDGDFSELIIKKIDIYNSKNDCVDLSYGIYKLEKINVRECGDKGVSIGERSKVEIKQFYAENTSIGLASKDSSMVAVGSSFIKNTKLCYAAYRKKQEFSGAKIVVENSDCEQNNDYNTPDSEIVLMKKIL